ncbi:hypothetical protein LX16_1795 [Stackebrandtia albiflava]|uniref:Uncharacterized protein n=1 Tax=Stackebrandtia albiflava TaxID=406432 RepID=A0A562VDW9_9ACTN|nr:hypothetical protein [Stackebrandtia albiflava]TWJ16073.1 hypothetical protein LX16_1795 [Stackebrandtia albiflava]
MTARGDYEGHLADAYGDLAAPTWHFVTRALRANTTGDLYEAIHRRFPGTREDTDPDCEVCFTYMVPADRFIAVKVSMAGPFATTTAYGRDGFGQAVLLTPGDSLSDSERWLLECVARHGYAILDAGELARGVSIRLRPDATTATVEQAFFHP